MLKKSQVLKEGRNIGLKAALLVLEEVQRQYESGEPLNEGKIMDTIASLWSKDAKARKDMRKTETDKAKNADANAKEQAKKIKNIEYLRKLRNTNYSKYLEFIEKNNLKEEDVASLEQQIKNAHTKMKEEKSNAANTRKNIESKVSELKKQQDDAKKAQKHNNNIENAKKMLMDLV